MTTITELTDLEIGSMASIALLHGGTKWWVMFAHTLIAADRAKSAALAANALTDNYTRTELAWRDAPTVPGLWLNSVFMKVEDVEQWHIDCQLHLECARWYGPIPPDGDKP